MKAKLRKLTVKELKSLRAGVGKTCISDIGGKDSRVFSSPGCSIGTCGGSGGSISDASVKGGGGRPYDVSGLGFAKPAAAAAKKKIVTGTSTTTSGATTLGK